MTAAWLNDLLRSIKEQRSVEFCGETLWKSGFSFTPAACSEYREELRHELSDLSVREKELKDELRALLRSYGMTDLQISWGIGSELTKRQMRRADKIYDQLSTVWLERDDGHFVYGGDYSDPLTEHRRTLETPCARVL